MHIKRIQIDRWRHFDSVVLDAPDDAPIVCLVGGNGTGKSQILELIAACGQRIGLIPGIENPRGDPFGEDASFDVTFGIKHGIISALDTVDAFPGPQFNQCFDAWDRSL